jgi:mannose-1-phosphate guanylyltransferase
MYAVILAGGSGTRFWPLSRKIRPKQLISVFGGKSMLQRTVERVLPLHPKRIIVVTNELQAKETAAQLEEFTSVPVDVISEPVGRNTAPAIGLAAALIARHDSEGVMAVFPADHFISEDELFRQTLTAAREAALNGWLVTLGIVPTRPETGYGYIEADRRGRGEGPFPVLRFVEKPPMEKALEFLDSGNFFWNSGMFVWKASTILCAMEELMPDLRRSLARLESPADVWEPRDLNPEIRAIYAEIQSESIDYGIMEKARNVLVLPVSFPWSDVGSWDAFPDVLGGDSSGNVVVDAEGSVVVDASRCVVCAEGKMVGLVGVRDLIVVSTGDALLVCARDRAQDVKRVVEELERRGLREYL